MYKEEIFLKDIIKDDNYNYLSNLNILIKNVEIKQKTMELIIYMESSVKLNNEWFNDLEKMFKGLFNKFKIILNISYINEINTVNNKVVSSIYEEFLEEKD